MNKIIQSGKTVILLLANPTQAESIKNALRTHEKAYDLEVFSSLSEARTYLSKTTPDLVMASLDLPDGQGIELFTFTGRFLDCPLIILAEDASYVKAQEATRLGAQDYILTDVTPPHEIHRIISRNIRQHHFDQEYKSAQQALLESEERARSTLELIRMIMQSTSGKEGNTFLRSFVQHLALALKVPFAGLGITSKLDDKKVSTLAFWNQDHIGENFVYDLRDTPCQVVFKNNWCIFPKQVAQLFPKDQILVDMRVESYMGITLLDPSDRPIGILWVMDKEPFRDTRHMKEVMSIFAVRAQAELELLCSEKNSNSDMDSLGKSFMDGAFEGFIITDEAGMIESINRAAENIFGYSSAEVTGNNINILLSGFDSKTDANSPRKSPISTLEDIIGRNREVTGIRKEGKTFPADLTVSEVIHNGKRHFSGLVRDITSRKRGEKELIEAKIRAEKASLAKTEFLARLSHEFRTPLNSIMGFSQLLEVSTAGQKYPEHQINFIDQILKAGSHLLELINEILDLSRVESGKVEVNLKPIPLPDLFDEMISYIKPLADKKGLQICQQITRDQFWVVRADKSLIKQCLLNLLSNAVKYNRPAGEINLGCCRLNPSTIQIFVSDTGPGLTPEQQKLLFEPFERLGAENTDVEGTGIGLTLTRKMVELMGGEISIESQSGKGTTFYMTFPVCEAPPSEILQTRKNKHFINKPEKILKIAYIEDNPANLILIERILARIPNIHLKSAVNGNQGLKLIQEEHPDLILLDMGLPDMDGIEILKKLKQQESTRNIPVVVLSANALKTHIDESLAMGIDKYLTKPIDIKEFSELISSYGR